jgi:hypothetical protein
MTTPLLSTYVRNQTERRERQMQTAFPAKVLDWQSNTNTVRLEPQFVETWVTSDDQTHYEDVPDGDAYIDNVPVLFPRSGSWSITFPIETGSFGMVICTKYSLDAFRNQGNRVDPGDLRRFTMSGAVFHPVNLHPNSSALSSVDESFMILSQGGSVDFVALKEDVDDIKTYLDEIKSDFNQHTHIYSSGPTPGAFTGAPGASTPPSSITSTYTVTASSKVKVE